MTTILNYAISNPALPVDRTFGEAILALPGFHRWFQANDSLVTLNAGNVESLIDKGASGAVLIQANTALQAALASGQFGNYPGLDFDGVDDRYNLSPSDVDTTEDFTFIAIFKGAGNGQGQHIISNYAGTNVGSWLGLNTAGNVYMQHGTGVATDTPVSTGAPTIAIGGNSNGILKLRVNGGATISAANNNAGSSGQLRVGCLNSGGSQFFAGSLSDLIPIQGVNLFDTALENIQMLEKYAARYAGVALRV